VRPGFGFSSSGKKPLREPETKLMPILAEAEELIAILATSVATAKAKKVK